MVGDMSMHQLFNSLACLLSKAIQEGSQVPWEVSPLTSHHCYLLSRPQIISQIFIWTLSKLTGPMQRMHTLTQGRPRKPFYATLRQAPQGRHVQIKLGQVPERFNLSDR